MSNKKNQISKAEKRKREKMKTKKRNLHIMIIAAAFFIIIITAFYMISMGNDDGNTEFTPVSDDYEQTETQIKIPVSSLTKEATFYTYDSNGVDVHYFAVKGDDGQVHVAIDACDVCYHAKEGYRQTSSSMECINCGLTFPIEDIGEKNTGGGCWPSFVPIQIEDANILIQKTDLDSKRFMFA